MENLKTDQTSSISRWKDTSEKISTESSVLHVIQSNSDELKKLDAAKHALVQKTIKKLQQAKGKDKLTEKDIEILNKRFMQGHLPRYKKSIADGLIEVDDDDDDDEDSETKLHLFTATENIGYIKKAINFQLNLLNQVQAYMFKYASKMGYTWFTSLIPINQIYTLAIFLLYTYVLNATFLMVFIPLVLTFGSLTVVVVSSLSILRGQRRFKEFLAWSDLLVSIDKVVDVKKAEDNYFKNHLSPVLSLPPAVVLLVMALSVESAYAPEAPLALLSFGFFATCLWSMCKFNDQLYVLSLATFFISTFLDGFNRTAEDFESWFSVAIPLFWTQRFVLNLSLSGIMRVLSCALFLQIPFQKTYRCWKIGVMQSCVPLLVTALWWELFAMFFSQSSWTGLGQTVALFVVTIVSLPIAGVLFLASMLRMLANVNLTFLVGTVILLLISAWLMKASKNNFELGKKFDRLNLGPSLKLLLYIVVVMVGLTMYATLRPSGLEVTRSTLSEGEYATACLSSMENVNGKLQQQKFCRELNGHHIRDWRGVVTDVTIISTENKVESVANVLPSVMAEGLACMYGERYPDESACAEATPNDLKCTMARLSQRPCHLQKYNRHKFSVSVKLAEGVGAAFQLSAGHSFQAKLAKLSAGDRVQFSGVLKHDAGKVDLDRLDPVDTVDMIKIVGSEQTFSSIIEQAWMALFRFVFSPLIVAV